MMSDTTPFPARLNARAVPLSEAETRAGLRAVGRVLGVARDCAKDAADPGDLADMLDSAGRLPDLLNRPADFRDSFRPALEDLVGRHPEFAPVLSEFVRTTDPAPRRRRRAVPEAELWIDWGGGD